MAAVFDMFRSRTAPPTGVHFKVSETEAQETVTRLQSYSRLKDQYAEIKRREFEWQARREEFGERAKRVEQEMLAEHERIEAEGVRIKAQKLHIQNQFIENGKEDFDVALKAR